MKKILLAGAALLALTTASWATDITPIPVVPPAPPPPPPPAFNWAGGYVGPVGVYYFEPGDAHFGIGGALGYNFVTGNWVLGAEGQVLGIFFSPVSYNFVGRVRAGFLANTNSLLYAVTGVGYYNNFAGNSGWYIPVGGGIEVAVGQSVSVRMEGLGYRYPGGFWGGHVGVGLLWHFGP
jgi:hypothetical protein